MGIPKGKYIVEATFNTGPLAGVLKGSGKANFGVDARAQTMELTPAGGGSLPAQLRSGLVLYLPFDSDGRTSRERSQNRNVGKVYGAKHTPSGKVGGAYELDGFDDFVECSDIDIDEEHTRAFWFKLNTLSQSNPYLFDTGDGNDNWVELFDHDDDGQFEIRAGAGEVTYVDGKREFTSTGQWYFVAATVDRSGQLTIYVDGDYDSDGSVTPDTPGTVRMGRFAGDTPEAGESFFDGVMDEVMVFNRALSPKEIKQIYDSQKSSLK